MFNSYAHVPSRPRELVQAGKGDTQSRVQLQEVAGVRLLLVWWPHKEKSGAGGPAALFAPPLIQTLDWPDQGTGRLAANV